MREPVPGTIAVRLARLLLPVAVMVGLAMALAAPVTWFVLRFRELGREAEGHARHLAQAMGETAQEVPELWIYNSAKLAEHFRARTGETPLSLAVWDRDGRAVYRHEEEAAPFVWRRAVIETPAGTAGEVEVGVSSRGLLVTALLLLLLFSVAGSGAAAFLYLAPVRAIAAAEDGLTLALRDLTAAREELRRANEALEVRVQEKTASLQEAHVRLRRQQEALQRQAAAVMSAQEEERRRIARDLHDSIGQSLTAVRLSLETLRRRVEAMSGDAGLQSAGEIGEVVEHLVEQVDRTAEEIRSTIHLVGVLPSGGLANAVRAVARQFAHAEGAVEVVEETTLVEPLPPAVEMCGLRVVQEAVTNAFRHGRAGKVWVRLAVRGDALLVTVRDDGQWVEPAAHGVGLAGMAERVAVLSGTLDVRSVAGQGVVVEAVLPLRPGEETEVRT